MFSEKQNVILGVCGGIAAYKSISLARLLVKANYCVQVVLTESAKQFVTPLTFQALTGKVVRDSLWDHSAEAAMGHIELARWADRILSAPATAHVLAKLAYGMADDLLSTLCLASKADLTLIPAMNKNMWLAPAVVENVAKLRLRGAVFLGPEQGEQACGDVGPGRMLEPEEVVQQLFAQGKLVGMKIIITAGPTREPIDPVRFLSNNSSGKMGYAFAKIAAAMGAKVTLISGPVALSAPSGVTLVPVCSASDMYDAVMARIDTCDVFISAAAVADYHCEHRATNKIKKSGAAVSLNLQRTKDILHAVGHLLQRPFIIGFAAETQNVVAQARIKMQKKNCDMMLANDVSQGQVFGCDESSMVLLTPAGERSLRYQSKLSLAQVVLEELVATQD